MQSLQVISVEGPIASGKSNFARELAEELEMLYVPNPSMDELYINEYGFDLRTLDDQLPEGAKSFDNKKFCLNPFHRLVGSYQMRMYQLKVIKYMDALAHLLSTGQGIVCVRSPFSDYVFLEAMMRSNYLSKGVRSAYYETRAHTITELLKPHLVIYLDMPVDKVKENIKKRNIDHEVKSPAFTDKYLQDIETGYKQQYLKEISSHSELLIYDWTEAGEPEVVVEDIERIDFDRFGHYDPKMQDWRIMTEWEWCEKRMEYTTDRQNIWCYFNIPRWDVPELIMQAEDNAILERVYNEAPGMKYSPGYNADMGDSGLLLKTDFKTTWRV